MTTKKSAPPKRGKPVNLYLRDADIERIRKLTVLAAQRGHRTSDSLIVRAALRAVNDSRSFLASYEDVAADDLRFKRE